MSEVLKETVLLFDVMDDAMFYTLNTVSRWALWEVGTKTMKAADFRASSSKREC